MGRSYRALGLMSGTSMDGIDLALIESDGESIFKLGPSASFAYRSEQRLAIQQVLGKTDPAPEVARMVTEAHGAAVAEFRRQFDLETTVIEVLGFHGQTIFHDPDHRCTVQLGDGGLLARLTGIDVVNDFRSADVAGGGQGAPFAPLYHQALAGNLARPVAIMNIGGVGNVTWLGGGGELLAFDTGPGNAMIDDWIRRHDAGDMDRDGKLGAAGAVKSDWVENALRRPYFQLPPPKSLDRDGFPDLSVAGMSLADGTATLTAFTAHGILAAARHFPAPVQAWYVCGGGRHNHTLMAMLADLADVPVLPVEDIGWRGDSLEAEAFAYLAVRSLNRLPLSLPATTGVKAPMPGGVFHAAAG